jgi:S1-C subfamily serine protease
MKLRKSEQNVVSGDMGTFDLFLGKLRAELLGGTAQVGVDRISQVIYSFSRPDGALVGSGFLLGDTGLLVTDSSILAGLGQGLGLGAKALVRPFAGGASRQAELVVAPELVLDYAIFGVSGIIETSPLALAGELPTVGEAVTACISVGETQGFHDGTVTGVDRSVPIRMWGNQTETIPDLIETDIKVAPGACGSPLVRKDGRVVGVLVAGNGRSYALNALRLGKMLAQAP